ncbi:MAG TPA: superoxide dismutase [Bacteroidetes bacterium]|nr:superoxide dismutase [Bacteroidota bacterium]
MKILVIFSLLIGGLALSVKSQHSFPELPYSYDALEVFIDKTTMDIHYNRHHKAYYKNFVKAAKELNLDNTTLVDIFGNVSKYPTTVRNNGGGYYNHSLFWEVMSPNGGGQPNGDLMKAIEVAFGNYDAFTKEFERAATSRFGSGWAWLSVDANGELFVSSTPNQDNPLMDVVEKRGTPILGLDVWEHAYYLHYQNKRGDYVNNFWKVVNWDKVQKNYDQAIKE